MGSKSVDEFESMWCVEWEKVENCMQQLIGNCCRLSSIRLYREWIFLCCCCCCYFNCKPTKIGYNFFYIHFTFAIHFDFQSYITNRKTYVCFYSQWAFYLDTTATELKLTLSICTTKWWWKKKTTTQDKRFFLIMPVDVLAAAKSYEKAATATAKKSVRELNQIWHATKENRAIHSNFVLITHNPRCFIWKILNLLHTHTHNFKNHLQLLCPACIFCKSEWASERKKVVSP